MTIVIFYSSPTRLFPLLTVSFLGLFSTLRPGPATAFPFIPIQQSKASSSRLHSLASEVVADIASKTTEDVIQELLVNARRLGPFGCYASASDQEYIRALARQLKERGVGSATPAREVLSGPFSLVYSDSTGASSGKLGFLQGNVIQEFISEDRYINRLSLWDGLVELALLADLKVTTDYLDTVKFLNITWKAFGRDLYDSSITGGGVWDYLFLGPVRNEQGEPILLRVLLAPSLFILEQPLSSN